MFCLNTLCGYELFGCCSWHRWEHDIARLRRNYFWIWILCQKSRTWRCTIKNLFLSSSTHSKQTIFAMNFLASLCDFVYTIRLALKSARSEPEVYLLTKRLLRKYLYSFVSLIDFQPYTDHCTHKSYFNPFLGLWTCALVKFFLGYLSSLLWLLTWYKSFYRVWRQGMQKV